MKKLTFSALLCLLAACMMAQPGNGNGNSNGNGNANGNGNGNGNNPFAPKTIVFPPMEACGEIVLDAGCNDYNCYEWSNGASGTQSIVVNSSGIYTVEVGYDLSGDGTCDFFYFKEFTVTIYPLPTVDLGPDQLRCAGNTAVLDAGPGMAAYLWNTGETSQSIVAASTGTYTVEVTDINGCMQTDQVQVTISDPIVLSSSSTKTCGLGGTATVTVQNGGTAPFSYLWSDGQATPTATDLEVGQYIVVVTDANGCTASETVVVSQDDYCTNIWDQHCGITINNLDGSIATSSVVPGADMYRFTFTNVTTGSVHITEGNIPFGNLRRASLANAGLSYNSDYTVTVAVSMDGGQTYFAESAACDFFVGEPLTGIWAAQCGITVNNLSGSIVTSSVVLGADMYRFTFTNVVTGSVHITEGNIVFGNLRRAPLVDANLTYNTDYTVTVAVSLDGGQNYFSESAPCDFFVGEPLTGIWAPQCGATVTSLSGSIVTSSTVIGANMYRFTFTNVATGSVHTTEGNIVFGNLRRAPLADANLSYNSDYTVTVAVSLDGGQNYFSESAPCDFFVGPQPPMRLDNRTPGSLSEVTSPFKQGSNPAILAYPNPAPNGEIRLSFKVSSDQPKIMYSLLDAQGNIIIGNKKGSLTERIDVSSLPSGTYYIYATIDSYPVAKKILIQ